MTTAVAAPRAAGPSPRRGWVVLGVCTAVAVATLPLPAALGFDPWAWLVWGREIARLGLDTTGGPSWKPLPVLLTTVLAPLGAGPAEALLAVVVRAGTLVGLVAAHRLASRFGGRGAGWVAVGLLLLTPDGDPRFLRLVAEGHVAPLSVTLALLAVEAHLDGNHRRTQVLLWCLAMDRPEAWPLLLVHAAWLWRHHPRERTVVGIVLASVPLLWFVPDWWGSGSPLHGADAAQVSAALAPFERLADAVLVTAGMVPLPAWIAAGAVVAGGWRTGERMVVLVAAAAAAWSVLVVVMATALGYAALSRFHLPAAAVVCVLAGIGAARSLDALRGHRAALVAVVVASVALVAPRVVGALPVLDEVAHRGALEDDLDRLLERAGGSDRLAACGEVVASGPGLLRSSVPWKLDLPLHRVPLDLSDGTGVMILPVGGSRAPALAASPVVEEVARTEHWVAFAVRCPGAMPDV